VLALRNLAFDFDFLRSWLDFRCCLGVVLSTCRRSGSAFGPRFEGSFCHTFSYSQPNKNSTTRTSATYRPEDKIEYLFVARSDKKKLSSDDITPLYQPFFLNEVFDNDRR